MSFFDIFGFDKASKLTAKQKEFAHLATGKVVTAIMELWDIKAKYGMSADSFNDMVQGMGASDIFKEFDGETINRDKLQALVDRTSR